MLCQPSPTQESHLASIADPTWSVYDPSLIPEPLLENERMMREKESNLRLMVMSHTTFHWSIAPWAFIRNHTDYDHSPRGSLLAKSACQHHYLKNGIIVQVKKFLERPPMTQLSFDFGPYCHTCGLPLSDRAYHIYQQQSYCGRRCYDPLPYPNGPPVVSPLRPERERA